MRGGGRRSVVITRTGRQPSGGAVSGSPQGRKRNKNNLLPVELKIIDPATR